MDEKSPERGKAPQSLAAALRSARSEAAERTQSMADLRGVEIGRLDLLREALQPVLAQVPAEIDLFDTGLVPGEHPRLFIDMIAFIDMARDRRTYRFHLDTRHGRVLMAENEGLHAMTGVVTDYIARRLVEREKALASLVPEGLVSTVKPDSPPPVDRPPEPPDMAPPGPGFGARMIRGLRFGIEGLGLLALAALVWVGVHYVQGSRPW